MVAMPKAPELTRVGQLEGLTIGVLIRVATDDQVDNYSVVSQEAMLTRYITQEGGAIVPYDENEQAKDASGRQARGVFGRRLAKRKVARRLLDDVKARRVHGIGVADMKRLTRDEFGEDAGVIAKTLVAARALLVAPGRVYRLWNKDDLSAYRYETLMAGRDLLDIRDTFWRGVCGRGEREPFFMNKPPFGYTTELIEISGARSGLIKIKRIPKKNPADAQAMADLAKWLDECVSLGEVAHQMKKAGHLPPIVRGRDTGARTIWTTFRIRWMFKMPVYYGQWLFGHSVDRSNPVWDTDQRRERIKAIPVPELAYWTRGQVLGWQEKFAASPSGRAVVRYRTYERPLLGVLACYGCGRPMIAAGKLGYQCTTKAHAKKICPDTQTLSETLAAKTLREIIPEALREASTVEEEARRLAAAAPELEDLRSQASIIQVRLDLAAEQWYGRQTPRAILDEMERDGIELERLRERIADEEARSLAGNEADEALQLLLSDPEGTFDSLPWEHQAWIYRLLLADVKMRPSGRGPGRRLEVTYYRNKLTGSTGAPSDRRMPNGSADFAGGRTYRTETCHR